MIDAICGAKIGWKQSPSQLKSCGGIWKMISGVRGPQRIRPKPIYLLGLPNDGPHVMLSTPQSTRHVRARDDERMDCCLFI